MNTHRLHVPLVSWPRHYRAPICGARAYRAACSISVSEQGGQIRLHIDREDATLTLALRIQLRKNRSTGSRNYAGHWRRGRQLTAKLTFGEAGTFSVRASAEWGARGRFSFVPDAGAMAQNGFSASTRKAA